tara:strand:+ start:2487 stop:2735 length:249 start_codon:yes stop_codon:yes gene_type:complete
MSNLIDKFEGIIHWPKKPLDKKEVLHWLATQFEFKKEYNELEINEIIKNNHLFNDVPLLRRELVSQNFLNREKDGSVYWRIK